MSIPVNVPMWAAAVLPIVLLLVLMVKLNWPAAKAAPVALAVAVIVSLTLYRTDIVTVGLESLKGVWSALVILIVVWPAIIIYEITNEAQAFDALKLGIRKMSPHELIQMMALGWIFPSFLQGITGFGVAVAVGAPLLCGIGVKPLYSVIIVLLGHSWGATFGTLALAWQALITQSGIGGGLVADTALWAGIFIWFYNFVGGFCLCWFYGRGKGLKEGLPAVLILSTIQGGGQLLLGQVNQTLACFLPTCVALVAVLLMGRTRRYGRAWQLAGSAIMDRSRTAQEESGETLGFNQAFLPYYVLTGVTLFCLLIGPVKAFLEQWQIGFAFPEQVTGYGYVTPAVESYSPLAPLTYPGTFLIISCVVGYVYFKARGCIGPGGLGRILRRAVKKTVPSSVAVIGFIVTSKVMGCSGQVSVLAEGIVSVLGVGYAFFAPIVGLLGAFMTSSNMASNILFAEFQMTTAELLGLSVPGILGAQTAGGAIGSAICPGNIVLGTSTTGQTGEEGTVLGKVLPITVACAAICGVALFICAVLLHV